MDACFESWKRQCCFHLFAKWISSWWWNWLIEPFVYSEFVVQITPIWPFVVAFLVGQSISWATLGLNDSSLKEPTSIIDLSLGHRAGQVQSVLRTLLSQFCYCFLLIRYNYWKFKRWIRKKTETNQEPRRYCEEKMWWMILFQRVEPKNWDAITNGEWKNTS